MATRNSGIYYADEPLDFKHLTKEFKNFDYDYGYGNFRRNYFENLDGDVRVGSCNSWGIYFFHHYLKHSDKINMCAVMKLYRKQKEQSYFEPKHFKNIPSYASKFFANRADYQALRYWFERTLAYHPARYESVVRLEAVRQA